MEFINLEFSEICLRLTVALILGGFLGFERGVAGKSAGPRTFGLVCIGSALFTILTHILSNSYMGIIKDYDPLRLIAAIIVGVGFLGAGTIFVRREKVHKEQVSGLTTAAGLWVVTGIGIAAGIGDYKLALFSTLLIFFVFTILWFIEHKVKKKLPNIYNPLNKYNEK